MNMQVQDEPLTVAQVAKRFKKGRSAVVDWIKSGVEGVRLKAIRVGRSWIIYEADLAAFISTLTAKSLPASDDPAPQVESPSKTKKRAEAAMDRLRKKGVPIS